jgi:hypothetical protein
MVQVSGVDPCRIRNDIEIANTIQTEEAIAHMTRSLGAWELSGLAARFRAYAALDSICRDNWQCLTALCANIGSLRCGAGGWSRHC